MYPTEKDVIAAIFYRFNMAVPLPVTQIEKLHYAAGMLYALCEIRNLSKDKNNKLSLLISLSTLVAESALILKKAYCKAYKKRTVPASAQQLALFDNFMEKITPSTTIAPTIEDYLKSAIRIEVPERVLNFVTLSYIEGFLMTINGLCFAIKDIEKKDNDLDLATKNYCEDVTETINKLIDNVEEYSLTKKEF